MARSILGTAGLALTLAFAIPVAYLGLEFLLDGKTNQGLLFLGIAVLMVGIQEYVTTPMDLPGEIAGKVLGTAVKEPEAGGGAEDDGAKDDAGERGREAARPETGGDRAEKQARDGDADGATEDEPLIPDAEGEKSG